LRPAPQPGAGLLTGRYPIRTGLGYDVLAAGDARGLPRSEETLGALAKRSGYSTKLIGKWHLGRLPEFAPTSYGFDEFFGVPYSNDMPGFALYRGTEIIERPVDQSSLTRRYTAEAVEFIHSHAQRPFLLLVAHTMPHIPLFVSATYAGQSDAGLCGDVIEELDASVGEMVHALKSSGTYEDTIIIFTSDYYFNNEEVIGVRTQRWKYLTHACYRRSLGAFEKFDQLNGLQSSYELLFDASPASGEEYSYADRHPELVSELKAEIAAARERFAPLRTQAPTQRSRSKFLQRSMHAMISVE
jgi:arylsulfatase A-like enzyme